MEEMGDGVRPAENLPGVGKADVPMEENLPAGNLLGVGSRGLKVELVAPPAEAGV